MRKIQEVLRLYFGHSRSKREIARIIGVSPTTVSDYLARAKLAGLSYPLPSELDEPSLERLLFPPSEPSSVQRPAPDWLRVHNELRGKGVTLELLWQEYKAGQEDGFQYSAFCDHYRRWRQRLSLSMRQTHTPGEKLFIDYAGQTVAVTDGATGEIKQAQIFVAVLGASNYTYIEATWSQQLPDWIASHVRALNFFGGCTELWVPDNLRSGVTKASRYEPDLNPTYQDLANHYGVAVLPARVRRPKDKSKVENAVLVMSRWVLARLRHQRFFSLGELNREMRALLTALNQRPFKKLPGTRREWFERLDRPVLRPLPPRRYEVATFKQCRVNVDYHVEIDGHYYSVPHALVRKAVEARVTRHTIEILYGGKRVALHARNTRKGSHSTVKEHMPVAHRAHLEWTPGRLLNWAASIGPSVAVIVEYQLTHKSHPEMGYRACLGLLSLAKKYGKERLEAACARAVAIGSLTRKSVVSILENHLDRQATLPVSQAEWHSPMHDNVRGPDYYH